MNGKIINDWNKVQPQPFYTVALKDHPVCFDTETDTWVIYSYRYCKEVLLNNTAEIPVPQIDGLLNDNAVLLIKNLVRLNNNEQHIAARQAAHAIYNTIQPVDAGEILDSLISGYKDGTIDWVNTVCKKLPVLYLLKGFGFADDACNYILLNMGKLIKIMSPQKTEDDINKLNLVIDEFLRLADAQITNNGNLNFKKEEKDLYVCNLIGLLIQSYDAGRGLLCNALVNLINYNKHLNLAGQDAAFFNKQITETLRFDAPVHNTRRVAVADVRVGDHTIKNGEKILIVMAAANLDPEVFDDHLTYNPERKNNAAHLTFGAGGHECLAKHLMVKMAADTCMALFTRYKHIAIPEQSIEFEPQLNVRLIKSLILEVV